ncbi:MAG: DCC1-like thiol-disulfide oxidoreductase family protein [Actinomycetota bacterium]
MRGADTSTRLTVVYDERCGFCVRCRDWLAGQRCLVPVELLPAGSGTARRRFGALPWLGDELVVVDERGRVWVGPGAFLMCLWATARFRSQAFRLSRPGWARSAERFFLYVSKRRSRWGALLDTKDPRVSWCDEAKMRWDP